MRRSTGPKSEHGKAISSQNAVKHGLTSQLNNNELEALAELTNLLTEEHTPEGTIEILLVSDLASIRIKLSRFDRAETAMFNLASINDTLINSILDSAGIKNVIAREEIINHIFNETDFEIDVQCEEIEWCKKTIKTSGRMDAMDDIVKNEILQRLKSDCFRYALEPADVTTMINKLALINEEQAGPVWHYDVTDNPEELKEREVYIDSELIKLSPSRLVSYVKAKLAYLTSSQNKQTALTRIRKIYKMMTDASMPSQQELDRLYRYRTTLEKQFTSKLSQLIQLQEMRVKKERSRQIATLN
jgi:hypothetical protein